MKTKSESKSGGWKPFYYLIKQSHPSEKKTGILNYWNNAGVVIL
ncbi:MULTISPECIES: hypothetical protein [unclassified Peribacillus]|nr:MULTISPECIES: hypothetical protein [unclassified Peribacillus]WMX57494.1 hypothetical protein RE409_09870 [Peribacillus sp. R9-11]